MNGITKSYVGLEIMCDRTTIDSGALAADFGMDESNFIHQSGDDFDREIDAVMAFGLIEGEKSAGVNGDNRERGSYIIQKSNGKFTYTPPNIGSKDVAQIVYALQAGEQFISMAHTHGKYEREYDFRSVGKKDNNIVFSDGDRETLAALQSSRGTHVKSYLINPLGYLLMIDSPYADEQFIVSGFPNDPNNRGGYQ